MQSRQTSTANPPRFSAADQQDRVHRTAATASPLSVIPARVVFLTHYIPLYQVQVLRSIASRVKSFHVLLSTPIEPNRDFQPDWDGLNVTVQKTLTLRRRWKHRGNDRGTSFQDPLYVHVPYDTGSQLRRLNPDIVMSLELGARSLAAVRYCRNRPWVKSILCTYMSEHTERCRGRLRTHLRRFLLRRADAVTYNGPSCRAYLESLKAKRQRLYHLPYAADDRTVYRGPLRRDDDQTRCRLLTVGQLSERKGVLPMLHQLSEYCRANPERNVELCLAGDGPLRSAIEAFQGPETLRVKCLGNVAPDRLGERMSRCGLLVAPTLADEWLLVVNEALQAGLPIIGSVYAQAVTTLVREGFNGWHYRPGDQATLARALDRYFAMPAESLQKMRTRCRESVADRTPAWAADGAIQAIDDMFGKPDGSRSIRSHGESV